MHAIIALPCTNFVVVLGRIRLVSDSITYSIYTNWAKKSVLNIHARAEGLYAYTQLIYNR